MPQSHKQPQKQLVTMLVKNIVRHHKRVCLTVFWTDLDPQKSSHSLQGCKNHKRAFFKIHPVAFKDFMRWSFQISSKPVTCRVQDGKQRVHHLQKSALPAVNSSLITGLPDI